eukprot:TRINITY_DN3276_c0_g2_i1.p1 TRINITY_DN3276_c0_g2~~TRINITY_DN3276_c0_g2_i1.p1  ORF type:complete len:719 (-),score=24.08 TRINITY_DN3276_c0_g2_i1:66-2222(-)
MRTSISGLRPSWSQIGLLVIFVYYLSGSLAQACTFYDPGKPTGNKGVPVCPCGFAFVTRDGPDDCPSNFGTAGCYPSQLPKYSNCGSHPRCCCTTGGCCDRFGRYRPSTFLCTAARGLCERDRYCNGTSPTCPSNFRPAGAVCKPQTGPCENDWTCTGSSFRCPSNYKAAGVACASARGLCEANRVCSGSSSICPSSWKNGTVCANSTGLCENNRVCVLGNPYCPSGLKPNTTICRASTGGCQADAYCSGTSPTCPSSFLYPAATVCGLSTGACQSNATCSGTGPSCGGTVLLNGTICRRSTKPCDMPIVYCNGTSTTCPGGRKPAGTPCGTSTICPRGQSRVCTGTSSECPEPAQCVCLPGEYGRDCSCVSPGPGFGATCLNSTWISVKGTTAVIPRNTTTDLSFFLTDDAYIDGDFIQSDEGVLIMSLGSSLTITGDVAFDGSLRLNVSAIPNAATILTTGGQSIQWTGILGSNPDGGFFDSVSLIGTPSVPCYIPILNQTWSNVTRILSVVLSFKQDPLCLVPCPLPAPPGAQCYGGGYTIASNLTITEKVNISTSTQVEGSVILKTGTATLPIGEKGSIAISGVFAPLGTLNIAIDSENARQALNGSAVTTRIDFDDGYCEGNATQFSTVSLTLPSTASCISENHTTFYGENSIAVVYSFAQIPNCSESSGGLVIGAIIGIAAACVVAVAIMLASVYLACFRKRVRPFERRSEK